MTTTRFSRGKNLLLFRLFSCNRRNIEVSFRAGAQGLFGVPYGQITSHLVIAL